jgi:LuxR family maltose regulon positive regulatory protein
VTRRDRYSPELSPRQLEVMKLLATWMTSAEIAGQLHVSQNTAKSHIYAIYRKLGVSSRREAVAAARELGYIP